MTLEILYQDEWLVAVNKNRQAGWQPQLAGSRRESGGDADRRTRPDWSACVYRPSPDRPTSGAC